MQTHGKSIPSKLDVLTTIWIIKVEECLKSQIVALTLAVKESLFSQVLMSSH
jgi:hypothetical protein